MIAGDTSEVNRRAFSVIPSSLIATTNDPREAQAHWALGGIHVRRILPVERALMGEELLGMSDPDGGIAPLVDRIRPPGGLEMELKGAEIVPCDVTIIPLRRGTIHSCSVSRPNLGQSL
jgi:hypothetical protein